MQRFTELKVWERSHALVLELYRLTASYPEEERFGIVPQLRRAAARERRTTLDSSTSPRAR